MPLKRSISAVQSPAITAEGIMLRNALYNPTSTLGTSFGSFNTVASVRRSIGSGSSKSVQPLTINTSIIANATAIWLAHGGFAASDSAGAKNNIIRNCEIACGVAQNTATTATFGINVGGTTKGLLSGRNNNTNQFLENRIIKCKTAIAITGLNVNLNQNNTISGNIIGPTSFGTDEIGIQGVYVQFQNLCTISGNTVQFVGGFSANTTAGADRIGIALGSNSWSTTSTTVTTGTNNSVTGNIVHDIVDGRTFSAVGILCATTASGPATNNLIANNSVFNIISNGTSPDNGVGIGHVGNRGDRIIFNSISMTGNIDAGGTSGPATQYSAGIKVNGVAGDTALTVSDNSVYVDLTSTTTTILHYCIVIPSTTYGWGSGKCNNNDYYYPAANTQMRTGGVGTSQPLTTSYLTLANWQAVFTPAQDGASIQADPLYVNSTANLQPGVGSPLVNAGVPLAGVTTDILGVTRSVTTPTIGAYENALVPPTDVSVTSVTSSQGTIYLCPPYLATDLTATVKNFGPVVTVVPVYYRVNGGSAVGPVNTVGPIPTNGTENVVFNGANAFTPPGPGTYVIKTYTALPADLNYTNDTNTITITVNPVISTFPFIETWNNVGAGWTITTENVAGTTPIFGLILGVTGPRGVAGDTAVKMNFFNATSPRREILKSPVLNMSSLVKPVMNFYVAKKPYINGENDSLQVVVSTDCGVTFFSATTVYNKADSSLPSFATRPPSSSAFTPDSAIQWRHETIDLSNVAGQSSVIIGFRAKSNFGNNGWIDNIIIDDADALCNSAVTGVGTYTCNPLVTLDFTATPAPPSENRVALSGGIKTPESTNGMSRSFIEVNSKVKVISSNNNDNPGGGDATVTQYTATDPGQTVAINTTATPPSGPIYTPTFVYHDYWFTVSYTGNDQTGYATYDLKLDLDGLVFTDPTKLYVVKRCDRTSAWVCQNTTLSVNTLIVTGLTDFSDFALAGDEALPVELSSFTSAISGRDVTLNWSTVSENNNSGFDVERSSANGTWLKVGNVSGNGTISTPVSYSFTDRNLATGNYSFRLKQIDFNGNFEYFNLSNEVIIGIPSKFELSQNYPNPFNPSTKISFALPTDGKVSLKIYDMTGKEVMTLVNEVKTAGYYSVSFNASSLSSGVYFYSLSADNFNATKKMMLIK